jgi:peptide/nickel transport system permease protein
MAVVPLQDAATPGEQIQHGFLVRLFRNRRFTIGLLIFLAMWGAALIAAVTIEPGMRRTGAFLPRQAPGQELMLGSDSLGRSVGIQLTEAIPNSIQVGLIAATVGTLLGALIGFVSGYFGGWLDAVLRVLIDVFLSVPSLLFLILLASLVRGINVTTMALIIGVFAWAWPARQVRAQVLSLKERGFVEVARLSGMGGMEIIVLELMPHMLPWLGANFVNAFISAVLAESGLSILGLGPQQEMTLGMMIFWALSYGAILQNLWWWWLTPVLVLMILFLCLYLVHLGFDEVSNPRLQTEG